MQFIENRIIQQFSQSCRPLRGTSVYSNPYDGQKQLLATAVKNTLSKQSAYLHHLRFGELQINFTDIGRVVSQDDAVTLRNVAIWLVGNESRCGPPAKIRSLIGNRMATDFRDSVYAFAAADSKN